MGLLTIILYAHIASGTRSAHLLRLSPAFLLMIVVIVRLVTSTYLLAWGWYTSAKLNFIPLFSQNFPNFLPLICFPLSVMNCNSTPNQHTMLLNTKLDDIILCYSLNCFDLSPLGKVVNYHKEVFTSPRRH